MYDSFVFDYKYRKDYHKDNAYFKPLDRASGCKLQGLQMVATTGTNCIKCETEHSIGSRSFNFLTMGKGDHRTRRGKIIMGTYGNSRPKRNVKKKPYRLRFKTEILENAEVKESPDWFQTKGYVHLSKRLDRKDLPKIEKLVEDEKWVASYRFYPLIYRLVIQKRLKKDANGKKINDHSTIKPRHIFYANHMDSAIYAYYAKVVIGRKYESYLQGIPGLSECVTAYRSIKVSRKTDAGKSNIHFAKESFDFIKKQEECVVLAFDITGFFDNLDHRLLKEAWARVCRHPDGKLNPAEFNIFKSLTRFSFIHEIELHKLHRLAKITNPKKRSKKLNELGCYCLGKDKKQRNKYFREKIAKTLMVPHSVYDAKISKAPNKGIPQGTPISAILANIYLSYFDEKVLAEVKCCEGLYRRYSDDILIVCPQRHEDRINQFIYELVASDKVLLEIKQEKTEISYFNRLNGTLELAAGSKPVKYLGFEFDGKRTLLKCMTLSRHHRRKKHAIKRRVWKTSQLIQHTANKNARLWTSEIWRKYSENGKGNFLTYAKKSARIMEDDSILRQVRKHKRKLAAAIRKRQRG